MDEPFRCLTELGDTALEALYATLRGEQGSWTLTDRAEWERVSTAVSGLTSIVLDERAARSADRRALGIYEPSRFPTARTSAELPGFLNDNEKALIIAGNILGMGAPVPSRTSTAYEIASWEHARAKRELKRKVWETVIMLSVFLSLVGLLYLVIG